MVGFVYVLFSKTDSRYLTYVGWTHDLANRLAAHNGQKPQGAKSTRGRQWQMIYAEKLPSRAEAMSREYALKRDRAFRKRLAQVWLD